MISASGVGYGTLIRGMKVLKGFYDKGEGARWASVCPLALILLGPLAAAQTQTAELPQAPVPNPVKLPGGVVVDRAIPGALPLSLDDAIDRGERRNLADAAVDPKRANGTWQSC